MSSYRLQAPAGVWIDRSRALSFRFNGRTLTGFAGDTLASALLASGVRLAGRSFKLHRPRGVWGCGLEEPSTLVDVGTGGRYTPNVRATLIPLEQGLTARSVNCWPAVGLDLGALTGVLAPFLPAGFITRRSSGRAGRCSSLPSAAWPVWAARRAIAMPIVTKRSPWKATCSWSVAASRVLPRRWPRPARARTHSS